MKIFRLLIISLMFALCALPGGMCADPALPVPRPEIVTEVAPSVVPTPAPTPEIKPSAVPTSVPARRIDPAGKMIALSFDDGPGAGTRRILSALDGVDGRATFFMVGNRMQEQAALARQVLRQGSEVASHSWSHPNLTKLDADALRRELVRGLDAVEAAVGVRPSLLRPPYGSVNADLREVARDLDLKLVNWNVDPEDWRVRNAAQIREHILRNAGDGDIVVCHDLYGETAAAMEEVVVELDRRGYQLVTISELLDARRDGGEAGRLYFAG